MASPASSTLVLPVNILSAVETSESEKWDGKITVTASTEGWEFDKEFQLESRVAKLKRKFHEHRYLKVKFLPTNVCEEKIQQMLSDFPVARIELKTKADSAGSADVFLEEPEMFEDWDKNRTFMLRGQRIPVFPTLTENWVCIARLPLGMVENEFHDLAKTYGEVRSSILMVSERTEKCKGYGLVDYSTKKNAQFACAKLQGLKIKDLPGQCNYNNNNDQAGTEWAPDVTVWAEILNPNCITFDMLHSRCLYISGLPPRFKDMAGFRKLLSVVSPPPYCQIAMKNGCELSWGLAEYNNGDEAEMTFNKLNGTIFKNRPLRIAYCIPGIRAIHLYGKLLSDDSKEICSPGRGLLPDPPAPFIYQAVKKLRQQNPVFAMNVEHIMVAELLSRRGQPENKSEGKDDDVTCVSPETETLIPTPPHDTPSTDEGFSSPDTISPDYSIEENIPNETALPLGSNYISQAALHHMMTAAQGIGSDPSSTVPQVVPYPGTYPFGPHIPMVPLGYIPIGTTPPPALYSMTINDKVDPLQCFPTHEDFPPQNPAVNLSNFASVTNVTPPEILESNTPNLECNYSPICQKADEKTYGSGYIKTRRKKLLPSALFNRLAPNGLVEQVSKPNGGIWATSTPPTIGKRRANGWPGFVEPEENLSGSKCKKARN